jgi:hypothetical protein
VPPTSDDTRPHDPSRAAGDVDGQNKRDALASPAASIAAGEIRESISAVVLVL